MANFVALKTKLFPHNNYNKSKIQINFQYKFYYTFKCNIDEQASVFFNVK